MSEKASGNKPEQASGAGPEFTARLLKDIPSVDRLLGNRALESMLQTHGHTHVRETIRSLLTEVRGEILVGSRTSLPSLQTLASQVRHEMIHQQHGSLTRVINLTGTVLHTNLGRALLPDEAITAIGTLAGANSNLEYDLDAGQRGDRDSHLESLLAALTGAEAATVVNNNAAAVLLCLNTLSAGKEVCISRGELVEIGGSFRIPEVMEKSNCRLREVGATNRTHLKDYRDAISADTGLLLKVHTSNYQIRGFTREVGYEEIAGLASASGLPCMADLGSGTLVDLENYGLEHEPTVQEVIGAGMDIVTFSGDKLLGGPQAGIVAGRKDLINAIRENPLKRALRVDKMTIAALTAVLKLYLEPETLAQKLPTLRHLSRTPEAILAIAEEVRIPMSQALAGKANVEIIETLSQTGSGALPLDQLPGFALALSPTDGTNSALQALRSAFRQLPVPVIGRITDGRLLFDCRTLDAPRTLVEQLNHLAVP